MKIKISVHNGLVRCTKTETIEVEDGSTDDEIETDCREYVFSNMIQWGWDRVEE
jgi:hypothetical protein